MSGASDIGDESLMTGGCCGNYKQSDIGSCTGNDIQPGDPDTCCYGGIFLAVDECGEKARKCSNNQQLNCKVPFNFDFEMWLNN